MGFRTVVVLQNDRSSEWENDPNLGKKIGLSASYVNCPGFRDEFPGGKVIECAHADTQSLFVIDSYHGERIAQINWRPNQTKEAMKIDLLKEMAKELGYRIVKRAE